MSNDSLIIEGKKINNRFFLGSGKFGDKNQMKNAILESGSEVITIAMRRVDSEEHSENILNYIPKETEIMINTSGARTATEAVEIARLAREAAGINWVKIEVIDDSKYLLPDNAETVRATETLAKEGFVVFPYVSPDLYIMRDLENAGAKAIMPLGSLIGSCRGVQTKDLIEVIISETDLPVIVDAGIGRPSHAVEAMEMGAAAVLANTAVSSAQNPVQMAIAFSEAVKAGRRGYLAGFSSARSYAVASSPLSGFLFDEK